MKLYKLTDKKGQTLGGTQWGPGVTHEAAGEGTELCSDGVIHAYEHPLIAVLMNSSHGNFQTPRLWEAEGEGEIVRDGQFKCGVKRLTTVQEIPVPQLSAAQTVEVAIKAALLVYDEPTWRTWAADWLSGKNRTGEGAAMAAWAAARATVEGWEAAWAVAWVAWAVTWAKGKTIADTAAWGVWSVSVRKVNLIAILEEVARRRD